MHLAVNFAKNLKLIKYLHRMQNDFLFKIILLSFYSFELM